jgi:hypothetical protein
MRRSVEAELNRAVKAAAAAYPGWMATMPQHRKRIVKIMEDELRRSALAGARHGEAQVRKCYAGAPERKLDTQEQLDGRIAKWAKRHAATKVEIAKTSQVRIRNAVARGLAANDPPNKIAQRIRADVGGMSTARARTIARTETAAAMGHGEQEEMTATAEELGVDIRKTWTATEDENTRETHSDADGQTIPLDETFTVGDAELMFPGDPDGQPEEIINCFIPSTMVEGQFVGGLRANYNGPVRRIVMRCGSEVTVTPNHPVFTDKGWAPARLLRNGDNLLCDLRYVGRGVLRYPDNQHAPASIKDAFDALLAYGRPRLGVVGALDLHGDSRFIQADVDIVSLDDALLCHMKTSGTNEVSDLSFPATNAVQSKHVGSGAGDDDGSAIALASSCGMRFADLTHHRVMTGGVNGLPLHALRIGLAAQYHAVSNEAARNNSTIDAEFLRQLVDAAAGNISACEIVDIVDETYAGHVYDLQACDGWLLSNGIVTSNCRCVAIHEVL